MTVDKNQRIGWNYEDTAETDPINSGTAKYWEFGLRNQNFQDLMHPIEHHEWAPIYKANSRTPTELELVKNPTVAGMAYFPTNLTPFHRIMGSRSAGVGHDHDFSFISSGSLKNFTTRSESTDGTVDKIFSMVGCKSYMLSGHIDFSQGFSVLSFTEAWNAIKNTTPSHNSKHTTGTKHPTTDGTMTGTEVKAPFQYDTNCAFHWDSASDDINYTPELVRLTWQILNYQDIWYINNQNEIEKIIEGNYNLAFSFELKRGADKSIYEEFLAETQHDMYFTIYAGSTNYMKLTWDDVGLNICDANYPTLDGKAKLWLVQGIAEGLAVEGTDGLDTTEFYP